MEVCRNLFFFAVALLLVGCASVVNEYPLPTQELSAHPHEEKTKVIFYKNGRKHGLQKHFIKDEKEEFFCQGKKLLSSGIKKDTCSVCWEETQFQTSCSHYICLECIQKMDRQQCPMCRHSF